MHDNGDAVQAATNIEFDRIGSQLHGAGKGRQGVLRELGRGAAMRDHDALRRVDQGVQETGSLPSEIAGPCRALVQKDIDWEAFVRSRISVTGHRWLAVALVLLMAAACENELNPFFEIEVNIVNPGSGAGHVESVEANLDIDCDLSPNGSCAETFNDAGGGGNFSLEATPSEGSTFLQWLGCTSTNGNVCNLSFAASDTTFNVTAYFVTEGGEAPGLLRAGR